jgi:hypothetical protein
MTAAQILKTRLATVYYWSGDKPIPEGTQITHAMIGKFSERKEPTIVGRKMLGKSHAKRIATGKGLWVAKEIPPNMAVTAEHVTKRKPLVPKFAVGDTVVMHRTVVCNINGSSVGLIRGARFRVEKAYKSESGRSIRYVLGVYYGPRDKMPIHKFDRSESCIQQKVAGDPW